jgi:CHAT domain-containing protein
MRAIAGLFGRAGEQLDRHQATEPALARARLSDAAILHFATHALVDERQPERSGLALTPAPPGSDGLLQTREVYRLYAPVALVTLSACETALGQHVTGEGMIGLARAFFYAGASAVLASLWNVNDASTATLMTAFYERVRAGDPLDVAAQRAKLALLAGDRYAHPYHWAPFVLSGHAGARLELADLPAPIGTASALAGVAILIVATLAVWALRRRRARL